MIKYPSCVNYYPRKRRITYPDPDHPGYGHRPFLEWRLEYMRCGNCGKKMLREEKDSLFRGHVTIYNCPGCGEILKRFEGPTLISSLFLSGHNGEESMVRRADPVRFDNSF